MFNRGGCQFWQSPSNPTRKEKIRMKYLQPLTKEEREAAEANHDIVFAFLRHYGYPAEENYNIAIFGYLHGIQKYYRQEEVREKYTLLGTCWYFMRTEMANYHVKESAQKRKPKEPDVRLDADSAGIEWFYKKGKSAETETLEKENVRELLKILSERQRKISIMKMNGYRNSEIMLLLRIPESSFYKEINKIKKILLGMEND